MTVWKHAWVLTLATCLLMLAACQDDRAGAEERIPDPGAPAMDTTQTEQPLNNPPPQAKDDPNKGTAGGTMMSARDSIVQARCEREERCNNIGSGKKYESRSSCESEVRSEWRDELNAFECPGGLNQRELDECKAEIRGEACDSMLDTLGRLAACRSGAICKD